MAFHPYPRVIPPVFNLGGFGPPRGLTPASACPWVAHPASRLRRATARPVRTRSRCGSLPGLASPHAGTRWLILQKARRHAAGALRLLVGTRFQVLFHSPPGVLFTFPSRYWCAIGHWRVFRVGGWSPLLPTGFHVSGGTRERARGGAWLRVRGSNPVPPAFPCRSAACAATSVARPTTPAGLSLPPVCPDPRSLAATGGISVDFSSSGYLDVSVRRVAPLPRMRSAGGWRGSSPRRVFPFGDPGVEGRVRLARDYRGLPRPSSASSAKASTACPWYLPRASRACLVAYS